MKMISHNTFAAKGSFALLGVCLLIAVPVLGGYKLSWRTIDGGGGTSSGGSYILRGTIGQPDAAYSAGGSYELLGGFWPGGPLCSVDFKSYAIFAEWWLETGPGMPADLHEDANDIVDNFDLDAFVNEWLEYCPYGWALK